MSESRHKRPAERAPSPARPNKGRPSNDRDATRATADYVEALLEQLDPFERENTEEIIGSLTKAPNDEWTQAQEDQVMDIFQSSGMKVTRDRMTPTSHPVLLGLFKVCLRVFGLTPVELISPLYGLNYRSMGSKGKKSPHIFSLPFCDALSGLIVHPNIDGNHIRLVCMLQFAVICRLDIRRPWLMPKVLEDCHVLVRLRRQMDDSKGSLLDEPVTLMHKELRNSASENGKECSSLSDYLDRISDISAETYAPVSEPDDGSYTKFGAFYKPITADDVALVARVIDETPIHGTNLMCTVSDALKIFREAKKAREFPSAREFPEIWERSQKKMLRIILQSTDARLERSQENGAPATSHQGNTGPEVSEPEEDGPVATQDAEMTDQDGEAIDSPNYTRFANDGRLTPVGNRMRRPQRCSSDLVPSSPPHGSSNSYPIRTRESEELSERRADEIESLREQIQQLEESRAQDRKIISGLIEENSQFRQELHDQRAEFVEELKKQGTKNTQILERLEKQHIEFIQELKDQNTNLFLRQSSSSRGAATVNTARAASPELGTFP
jgi:hypothetical protein